LRKNRFEVIVGKFFHTIVQFGRLPPSRLSDCNGFGEETLGVAAATDGNAPITDLVVKI
jgi:hypothetical protein